MNRVSHTFFINLDHRKDRLEEIRRELVKLPLPDESIERFPGILNKERGYIGCTCSHIKCMEMAINNNYESVFICEDDFEITDADALNRNVETFMEQNKDWDVLLICGHVLQGKKMHNECIRVTNAQTTAGYIVSKRYMKTLLDNFREGLKNLQANINNTSFRIDIYWKRLQKDGKWFSFSPQHTRQRTSYSDIEKRNVQYTYRRIKLV